MRRGVGAARGLARAVPAALGLGALACGGPETGTLELRVLDAASGREVPARLELLDAEGGAHVADEALVLSFECEWAPLPGPLRELDLSQRIRHRGAGVDHFYLDGPGRARLPAGRYRLRAFKGPEYRVARHEIDVEVGETHAVELALERWIDMPAQGWWSADDHIHITRRPGDDARIAAWMRAEDLHVANLLQMGTVDQFGVTPQHGFGDAGTFRRDGTLLVSGQEHPRTHFLGHTITLGPDAPIDRRESYIVYEATWREARRRNGLFGYAHYGLGPARDGLALDAPRGGVAFLEVLQFDMPVYEFWYELLDLGIRLAPTAGTDFPCADASVPGRERFYTALAARPTRASFLEAVRRGRTFVTNGPLLDLRVGDAGIGSEVVLAAPGSVPVEGRVWFDPARDDVQRVELLRDGAVVPARVEPQGEGALRVRARLPVRQPGWVALRVAGDKVGETPVPPPPGALGRFLATHVSNFGAFLARREAYHAGRGRVRPSAAHTAPVWIAVRGTHGGDPRRQALARAALARLDDLEARLADARIDQQAIWDWVPYSDGVSIAHLRRHRESLRAAIAEARARYAALVEAAPP